MKPLLQLLVLLISIQNFALGQDQEYKIVLIAGPNDHCPHERACHKYIQDLQVIRDCLTDGSSPIKVEVELLVADRPKVGSLDDVDAVVVHSGADDTAYEWHALFPQIDKKEEYKDPNYQAFLNYFDQQMDRGMGLAVLHYSTTVNHPKATKRYVKWIGGYYKDGMSEVDGDWTAPGSTAIETVEFATPDHPILNGIKPWTSEAEYYYRIYFDKGKNKPIPILQSMLPVDDPKKETIAWALEREDGGRGFGFTGCHNHENMYMEDFRTFVLNAVLWTAGAPIPEQGFPSSINKRYFK